MCKPYFGPFTKLHENVPAPFNEQYDPRSFDWYKQASKKVATMKPSYSRKERKLAWAKAYVEAKKEAIQCQR